MSNTITKNIETCGATLLTVEDALNVYNNNILVNDSAPENKYWLCTPAESRENYVAYIGADGSVMTDREIKTSTNLYVKPALNIVNTDYQVGETFYIDEFKFVVIPNNLAWLYEQNIGATYFDDSEEIFSTKHPDWSETHIKKYIDEWYSDLVSHLADKYLSNNSIGAETK